MERIEYKGWKDALRLANGEVELIATLAVGPRIISYRRAGGANVLKEYPEHLGGTGEPVWMARGGHRLWTAPEDLTRTYAPDNSPVTCAELAVGHVRLTQQPDRVHGVQKEIEIRLRPAGSEVQLLHRITNVGDRPVRLAPWALTVMAPGGLAIIPLPAKRPHPGAPAQARAARDYWPNGRLVLWPFTDLADPRWRFGSRYITLRQDSSRGPTKIGLTHRLGWVAHLNVGTLFVKRFTRGRGPHPDGGCNFETFTNEDMTELENLGPLVTLRPAESTELAETWNLHTGVAPVDDEAAIARHVLPLAARME